MWKHSHIMNMNFVQIMIPGVGGGGRAKIRGFDFITGTNRRKLFSKPNSNLFKS